MPKPAEGTRSSDPPPPCLPPPVRVDVAAASHRGHVREDNEDAYVVLERSQVLETLATNVPEVERRPLLDVRNYIMIVADGLGGHEAGEVASKTALLATLDFVLRTPKWFFQLDDPAVREREIQEVVARANEYLAVVHGALRRKAASEPALAGMGTTLTGAMSQGLDAFLLHVGDSRAYLWREGRLLKVTRDHTVAQGFADLGVIPQEEVPRHRMHHVLTRAVGGPEEGLQGDFHHLRLQDGDRLLLCSDGLTDMASEEEIAPALAAHPGSAAACQALVGLALERGGRDNVTAIVAGYRLEGGAQEAPAGSPGLA
jgi:protein phosphatase